jgi:ectoine hydroxylase-related dioxygenase (phytanoyl-CoA dioxygenase family)
MATTEKLKWQYNPADYDLDAHAAEIYRDGITVVRNVFPRELVQEWHDAAITIVNRRLERVENGETNAVAERGKNRVYVSLPIRPPFDDPNFLANPVALGIAERVFEGDPFLIVQSGLDTPFEGATNHRLHRDWPPFYGEDNAQRRFIHCLAANITLADVTAENGPLEVA